MLIRLECRNISYSQTVLYWSVEPDLKERLHEYKYVVQISESSDGPWIDLYAEPTYAFGYIDNQTQRGMVDQRLYYRVKAINYSNIPQYSDIVCLFNEESNYISDYISSVEQLMLRRYNGQDCLHYARKKFGERCSVCYDSIERKITKPKCRTCLGTTYTGGYFAPIKIRINSDPKIKGTDKTDYGINEANVLTGWTSNQSIIESDDVIIFLKKPSERYKVNTIIPTAMNGATIRQILTMTQVKGDDPIHLLAVDIDAYSLDEYNIFRRDWKVLN